MSAAAAVTSVVVTRRRRPPSPLPSGRRSTSFGGRADSMSVPSDLITASQQQPVVDVLCLPSPVPHRVRVLLHVSFRFPPSSSLRPSLCQSVCLPVRLCAARRRPPLVPCKFASCRGHVSPDRPPATQPPSCSWVLPPEVGRSGWASR